MPFKNNSSDGSLTSTSPLGLGPSSEQLTVDGVDRRLPAPRPDQIDGTFTKMSMMTDTPSTVSNVSANATTTSTLKVRSPFFPNIDLTTGKIWHLARRASPAPSNSLASEISKIGYSAWIDRQLAPSTIDDSAVERMLAPLPLNATAYQLQYQIFPDEGYKIIPLVIRGTMVRRLFSNRHLVESMTEFWHDLLHVTVSSDKSSLWVGEYDRLIRSRALGKFSTLLTAAELHPAMLNYLDNTESTKKSPNENLAREILELHTLGVGKFTEADVKAMAKLLTGMSMSWKNLKFEYRPDDHYVGALTIAGHNTANSDVTKGKAYVQSILLRLARDPRTAYRICRKLAVRFVEDKPSETFVKTLSDIYLKNDTDIRPVLKHLFNSTVFKSSIGRKLRRPLESWSTVQKQLKPSFVLASDWKDNPWEILGTSSWFLDNAGHLPLNWPSPDGTPDTAERWSSTLTMIHSWNRPSGVIGAWDSSLPIPDIAKTFGIAPDTLTAFQIVDKLIRMTTGFAPDPAYVQPIADFLWNGEKAAPAPTDVKVDVNRLDWRLGETLRLVYCTPYALIR